MKKISTFICALLILVTLFSHGQSEQQVYSYIQSVSIDSKSVETLWEIDKHFEAPNWSPDGRYLIVNSEGKLFKFYLEDASLEEIKLDKDIRCNNDHGISPDGSMLVISGSPLLDDGTRAGSTIYTMPINGGPLKQVTELTPSYWHGWSIDGKTLAFVGRRNGEYDIYSIPVNGGPETRLTTAPGLDDGPDYSVEGKYIYYNSFQSGVMELWRMDTDGNNKVQLTNDNYSNWFPHPSPDGRYLVYISYIEDQKEGHPFGRDVKLRLYDLKSGEISDLTEVFYGGQGTINVPSWSPDSKKVAFVRYKRPDQD